jgi:hypothetical protein
MQIACQSYRRTVSSGPLPFVDHPYLGHGKKPHPIAHWKDLSGA